jgi:hypothetical protein
MALPGRPPSVSLGSRLMKDHRCCYCQQVFQPAPYHPHQLVCNQPACQRQRRRDYHRQKITSDPLYRQVCLESPRKWRDTHPHYWKRYRHDHPQQAERNRQQQRWRDEKRRLVNLANNTLATCKALSFQSLDSSGPALPLLANNIPLASPLPLAYKATHAFRVLRVAHTDSGTSW